MGGSDCFVLIITLNRPNEEPFGLFFVRGNMPCQNQQKLFVNFYVTFSLKFIDIWRKIAYYNYVS